MIKKDHSPQSLKEDEEFSNTCSSVTVGEDNRHEEHNSPNNRRKIRYLDTFHTFSETFFCLLSYMHLQTKKM